jgi:hypothetical protein
MPVNEPTLEISDLATGGPGLATITGSTALTTNELWGQPYDPAFAVRPWRSFGSCSGDGTIAFSTTLGHWAFVVKSTLGAENEVSRVQYGAITDATRQSVLYQCILAAAVRVRALSLPHLANQSIVSYEVPWSRLFEGDDPRLPLPGIICCPIGSERKRLADNMRDDVEYPVLISIIARNNQELGTFLPRFTLWREMLMRAFHEGKLPGVQSVIRTVVEPGTIVLPEPFLKSIWHSALVVRCTSRERRGLGV